MAQALDIVEEHSGDPTTFETRVGTPIHMQFLILFKRTVLQKVRAYDAFMFNLSMMMVRSRGVRAQSRANYGLILMQVVIIYHLH